MPAGPHHGPVNRSYIVDHIAPGAASVRRRVEITNTTPSTVDVSVYPAAADLRRGAFVFAPGHSRDELASWTSVSRAVLRLSPGSKAFETVTINVPEEASSGTRYAVIWAEVSARAAAGGVTLVNRVGIRVYLSIGSGGVPAANFAIGTLTARRSAAGGPLVVADIRNSGQRPLDISGSLTLDRGPGGTRTGPFPVTLAPGLAPGDTGLLSVRLDEQLPRGPWQARIRLRSGLIQRTAVATITFPGAVASPADVKVEQARRLNLMLPAILLALLAVAALGLQLSRRKGIGGRRLLH
jgi:hypothetical protein